MAKRKFEEWQIEQVAENYFVIFHKEESREWVDEYGDNLCFDTKEQALKYLVEHTK